MSGLGASNLNLNLNLVAADGGRTTAGGTRIRYNTADYRKLVTTPGFTLVPAVLPTFPVNWDPDLRSYVFLAEFIATTPNWFATLDAPAVIGKEPTDPTTPLGPQLLAVLDAAPDREDRFAEIIDQHDADGTISYFLGMLMIDPARHPDTYLAIRVARRVGEFVSMMLKHAHPCPRPSQICPAITPMIDPPMTSSFPAGHAIGSRLIALTLKDARPNQTPEPLDYLAQRIAMNRVIAGVHFVRDIDAGTAVANACYTLLKARPNFAALLVAAAAEA